MRKSIQTFAALAVLGWGAIPAAQAASFGVYPHNQALIGELGSVEVWVSGLTYDGTKNSPPALGGYDVDIQFDPSIISLQDVSFGSGLDLSGLGSISGYSQTAPGVADVYEVSLDDTALLNTQQLDSFRLFTLVFKALRAGESALDISVQSASTAEGTNLAFDFTSGRFTVPNSVVPLPAAAWLLLSGLTGAFAIGRRRRADLPTPG